MPRRKLDDAYDVQIIFRVTKNMKKDIDSAADALKMPTADWIRNAVLAQLDRENGAGVADDELDKRIEKVIRRIMDEKK